MKVTFLQWIRAAGIRALKTIAQVAAAQLAVETGIGVGDVNWISVGSVSLLAGILSLLTSLAGLPELKQQQEQTVLYVPTDEQMENFHPPADEDGQDNQ